MRVKITEGGYQVYNEIEGEVIEFSNTVEYFDGKLFSVAAVILKTKDNIELVPLKRYLMTTKINVLSTEE